MEASKGQMAAYSKLISNQEMNSDTAKLLFKEAFPSSHDVKSELIISDVKLHPKVGVPNYFQMNISL